MLFKVGQPSILIWLLKTDYNHCNKKHFARCNGFD